MREHVSTVFMNTEHFAELITLHLDGDVKIKAIVDIPDAVESVEGAVDTVGALSVATADLNRLRLKDGLVREATIRNAIWHLYDQSTDELGMIKFMIRRKDNSTNRKYTNLYDLSGEQTTWQERTD